VFARVKFQASPSKGDVRKGSEMNKSEDWNRNSALICSGINRTDYHKTSEALFMTSFYVYEIGETSNFVYLRYGKPTLPALEERLANLEGTEDCRGY
tara:strand:+ start:179 stop:469 length:291 start_codon:yes stop_codon:yes gene_type:complete